MVAAPTTDPLKTFEYVDTAGKIQRVQAADSASALSSAPNIARNSGVILTPPSLIPSTKPTVTSSSGDSRARESKLGKDIAEKMSPTYQGPTNNMSYLDEFDRVFKDLYKGAIGTINSNYASDLQGLADAQKREIGSTSATLARAGGYLGESGSATGVLTNLGVEHRNEIASLEAKRQAALQAAREGYAKQSYDLAQARLAEANRYEQEATARKDKFFAQVAKATQESTIISLINQGITDPGKIYDYVNFKQDGSSASPDGVPSISIETINDVLSKYNPGGFGAFKFDNGDIGKLLHAGFSRSDISSVLDYVNTNGYDDKLRNSLTSAERIALDTVLTGKAPGTGTIGNTITIAEAKSLGIPTSLIGRSEAQVISDLNSRNVPQWYIEYRTSNWADPTVDAKDLQDQWNEFRTGLLQEFVGNSGSGSSSDAYDNLAPENN